MKIPNQVHLIGVHKLKTHFLIIISLELEHFNPFNNSQPNRIYISDYKAMTESNP